MNKWNDKQYFYARMDNLFYQLSISYILGMSESYLDPETLLF